MKTAQLKKASIIFPIFLPCLIILVLLILTPQPSTAEGTIDTPQSGPTFTVNTTAGTYDGVCGTSNCTLRDALRAANDQSGANTIELAASQFYTLTVVDNGINGLPLITSTITLNGNGATIARSTTAAQFRLLQVDSLGTLQLNQVTMSNGYTPDWYDGGAIFCGGTLTVTESTISDNHAFYNGGGIITAGPTYVSQSTFNGNSAMYGGGIEVYNTTLDVSNSTFNGNSAVFLGGGIYSDNAQTTVTNSTFSGNSAGYGGGVALIPGSLTLANTILANNSGFNCGGSFTDGGSNLRWPSSDTSCPGNAGDPRLAPLADYGGDTHTMALQYGSAAIDAGSDAICAAPPVNNLDQRGISRPQGLHCDIGAVEAYEQIGPIFHVNTTESTDDGFCSVIHCTLREAIHLTNNQVGANTIELETDEFYTLTLVDNGINGLPLVTSTITIEGDGATIARSTAGGIPSFRLLQVDSQGVLELDRVTMTNGYAPNPYYGGGIFSHGILTVTESTLSGNHTDMDGGAIYAYGLTYVLNSTLSGNSAYNGGGIEIYAHPLYVVNSTFQGNGASNKGGGIDNYEGQATVTHGTFSGNSAPSGGALKCTSCTLFDLRNSIFDTNTVTNCSGGGFTDSGGNLRWPSSDASCPGTAGDPLLAPLADNGGSTQTMALQPGSAALSHGVPAYCTADIPVGAGSLDQRGYPRQQVCDSGAYEAYTIYLPLIRR